MKYISMSSHLALPAMFCFVFISACDNMDNFKGIKSDGAVSDGAPKDSQDLADSATTIDKKPTVPSPCVEAGKIQVQASEEYCKGKETRCGICKCLILKQATPGVTTCEETPTPACEGEELTGAQTCLADKTGCAENVKAYVKTACDMTPLEASKCDKANPYYKQAFEAACQGKENTCCSCKCAFDETTNYDPGNKTCTCTQGMTPPCNEQFMKLADDCVADPEACITKTKGEFEAICKSMPL